MAWVQNKFLDKHAIIAKRIQAFALGRFKAFADVLFIIRKPHPLAAAARACLHHHRITNFLRNAHCMFGVINLANKAGHDVDTSSHRQLLGFNLVPHCGNCIHWRTNKGDVFFGQRLGKAGAFGQETIAWMYRLRPGLLARGDDLVGQQIRLRSRRRPDMHRLVRHRHKWRTRICIGIDRYSRDPHSARGLNDAASNFATVRDQDFFEHYSLLKPSP